MLWTVRVLPSDLSSPRLADLDPLQLYSNRQKDVHPGTTKLLARVVTLAVETNFLTGENFVLRAALL